MPGCEKRQIIFMWSNAKYDSDIQQVTIGNLHVPMANLLQWVSIQQHGSDSFFSLSTKNPNWDLTKCPCHMSEWNSFLFFLSFFLLRVLFILKGMFLITVEAVICRGCVIWKRELPFFLLTAISAIWWWCPPVSVTKLAWWVSLPGIHTAFWGFSEWKWKW